MHIKLTSMGSIKTTMPDHKAKQLEKEEKAINEAQGQGPIAVEEFLKQLKKKKKKNWLDIEFKTVLKFSQTHACDTALKPEHKKKNTYPNVLPFDASRVILECLPNDPNSDYINASFVDSSAKPKAYIAAQGPNRHTIGEFWRMIWQENVHCIVMASNLFEHARQQCEKYWHNQHGRYGGVDVWLEETDILADFVVRTFRISKQQEDGSSRTIKQFQFNGWSDHDVPNPTAVLEYRRKIHVFSSDKPGPLLVHCSTGAGRTGAFIATDIALEQLTTERSIDLLNLVLNMRTFRPCLLRTAQQYEFLYDTIAMYIQCGSTVINARELPTVVQKLSLKDPTTKVTGFEHQLKTLQGIVPQLTVGECAGGHRAENRRKSRDIMMQPPERARPYLMTHDSNDSTDYINACYIDGYRHPNAYIVTQWPLKSTVNDIWRLIFDYNIPTLVVLNDQSSSRSYPRFWPTAQGKHLPYGPLTVEFVEETEEPHVTTRLFKVRKTLVSLQSNNEQTESAKVIRMFHLRSWANNHRMPHNPTALVELLSQVEQWQKTRCHGHTPTLLVSRNGVSRVGTYCTISHCWDKMKAEGEVDVFTAAKTVKMNRPQLIDNIIDYMYCHTFLMMLTEILRTSPCRPLPVSQWSSKNAAPRVKSTPGHISDNTGIQRKPNGTIDYGQIELTNETLSPQTSEDFIDDSPQSKLSSIVTISTALMEPPKAPAIFITDVSDIEFIDASPIVTERGMIPFSRVDAVQRTTSFIESDKQLTESFQSNTVNNMKIHSNIGCSVVKDKLPSAQNDKTIVKKRAPTPHPLIVSIEDTESEDSELPLRTSTEQNTDSERPVTDEDNSSEPHLQNIADKKRKNIQNKSYRSVSGSLKRTRLKHPKSSQDSFTSDGTSSEREMRHVKYSLRASSIAKRLRRKAMELRKDTSSDKESVDFDEFFSRSKKESCYETCSPGSSVSSDWGTANESVRPKVPSSLALPLLNLARPNQHHRMKLKPTKKSETSATFGEKPADGAIVLEEEKSSRFRAPHTPEVVKPKCAQFMPNFLNQKLASFNTKYMPLSFQDSMDSLDTAYITADEGMDFANAMKLRETSQDIEERDHVDFDTPNMRLIWSSPERSRDLEAEDQDFSRISPDVITDTSNRKDDQIELALCSSPRISPLVQEQIPNLYATERNESRNEEIPKAEISGASARDTNTSNVEDPFNGADLDSGYAISNQQGEEQLDLVAIIPQSDIEQFLHPDLNVDSPLQEITSEDLQQVADILNDLDDSLTDTSESIKSRPHRKPLEFNPLPTPARDHSRPIDHKSTRTREDHFESLGLQPIQTLEHQQPILRNVKEGQHSMSFNLQPNEALEHDNSQPAKHPPLASLQHQHSEPLNPAPIYSMRKTESPDQQTLSDLSRSISSPSVKLGQQTVASFDSGILTNSTISIHSTPSRGIDTTNLNTLEEKTIVEEDVIESTENNAVPHKTFDYGQPEKHNDVSIENRNKNESILSAEARRAKFRSTPVQSPIDDDNDAVQILVVATVHNEENPDDSKLACADPDPF